MIDLYFCLMLTVNLDFRFCLMVTVNLWCFRPRVMWGTQEMMWPVSPNAMTGSATPRVKTLATPKKDFQAGTVYEGR